MKIGYYREDDNGHGYLIPEEEIKDFDDLYDFLGGKIYMDDPKTFDEFEDKFGDYRVDGIYDMKIIMDYTG